MKVYLNGELMEQEEARLPITDRGVLFGDGLFETIRAYEGRPFRMDRHLQRLRDGCRQLRMSGLPPDEDLRGMVSDLYRLNVGAGDAYVRITMTGGPFDGSRTLERPGPPSIFVLVKPFEGYPDEFYRRGMTMVVSSVRRDSGSPLSHVKSNNYLNSIIARQEARDRGADDAVMLNEEGHLAEATSSNIFMVRGGAALTPDAACGLLPGITRETVMELCGRLDLDCSSGLYTLEDLLGADEAFASLSTGEVVPIREVEGGVIGGTCPGPVTSRLASAYRELVREELAL